VRSFGLEEDERLIAFGEHRREDGRTAMQQILAMGVPFTAILASNDLSCLGAVEVLRTAGRRIPDDVAVIGFDDILDARSHLPPLTTVRHPTFALGYEAVVSLLAAMSGQRTEEVHTRVPTRLVIRQSCGCRPKDTTLSRVAQSATSAPVVDQVALARLMAEAALIEAQHSTHEEVEQLCLNLIQALSSSLAHNEPAPFDDALRQLCEWLEAQAEDANAWHAALSTLRGALPDLLVSIPGATLDFADMLIDRARLEIAEQAQRQTTDALLRHMDMSNRLGLMTAQLLTTLDAAERANVLTHHLPQLGLQHVLVAIYASHDEDPYSPASVLLAAGLPASHVGRQFATREFPTPEFYPPDVPFQLALLPLVKSYYAALYQRGVTTDFVHPEADLSHYRLVIVPHLYLVNDRAVHNITHYVTNGGVLVMSFFSGIVDERDHVRLGGYPAPFQELLGMHIEEFAPYTASQTNVIQSSDGHRFNCSQWSDVIHLHGAESVADYLHEYYADTPAITRHRFGQGISFYLGTMLDEEGLSWLLERACTEAKTRVSPAKPSGVELIQRSTDTQTWHFALNYSSQPVEVALDRSGRDLITGMTVDKSIVLGPTGVAIIQSALS